MRTQSRERTQRLWPFLVLNFATLCGLMSIMALLPSFRDRYGFSDGSLGVIVGAGFVGTFVVQLATGRFADRGHAPAMIRSGVVIVAVALAGLAVSHSLWQFVAARLMMGVGGGLMGPALRRSLVLIDPARVGTNLSMVTLSELGAYVTAPVLAGIAAAHWSLSVPLWATSIAVVAVMPIAWSIARRTPPAEHHAEAVVGAAGHVGWVTKLGGTVGVGLLVIAVLQFFVSGGMEATWGVQLADAGASPEEIGWWFVVLAAPLGLGAGIFGRLGDRYRSQRTRILLSAGFLSAACACVALLSTQTDSVVRLSVLAGLGAFAGGAALPIAMAGFADGVPRRHMAESQGMLGAAEVAMSGLGAVITAWMYGKWGGERAWAYSAALSGAAMVVAVIAALRGTGAGAAGLSERGGSSAKRADQ